ncbi:MAG: single-stranded DNA-binding protein [Solirubrobacteraceae bacterium]
MLPALRTHDINRVILSGHLAEEPDLYDLTPGPIVCFLQLRCDRHNSPHLLGEEGQLDISVILLGPPAANMAPYLNAGRRLIVDGSLASADHHATGSEPDETLCILAQHIELLDAGASTHVSDLSQTTAMVGFSEDVWV